MLTNETRRQLLNRAKAAQFPGSILEVYRAAEQGIDILADHEAQMQQQMQVAQTPQEQQTGLREEHAQGNTQASMAFPDVQSGQSFNTVGMKAPINVDKYDNQGHLVESYKNVPPGIKNLPTGPYEGTVIETPAEYQTGGEKDNYNLDKPIAELSNLYSSDAYGDRLKKEYANAHNINLSNQEVSNIQDSNVKAINTGNNPASPIPQKYVKPGLRGILRHKDNFIGLNLGSDSEKPAFVTRKPNFKSGHSSLYSTKIHEIAHRANAGHTSLLTSSNTGSGNYIKTTEDFKSPSKTSELENYYKTFFTNAPASSGHSPNYSQLGQSAAQSENYSDYLLSAPEVKSQKKELESALKAAGVWDASSGPFTQDHIEKLRNTKFNIGGDTPVSHLFKGLNIPTIRDSYNEYGNESPEAIQRNLPYYENRYPDTDFSTPENIENFLQQEKTKYEQNQERDSENLIKFMNEVAMKKNLEKANAPQFAQKGGFNISRDKSVNKAFKVAAGTFLGSAGTRWIAPQIQNKRADKKAYNDYIDFADANRSGRYDTYEDYCLSGDCPDVPTNAHTYEYWKNHNNMPFQNTFRRKHGYQQSGVGKEALGPAIVQGGKDALTAGLLTYGADKLLDKTRWGRKFKKNFNLKLGLYQKGGFENVSQTNYKQDLENVYKSNFKAQKEQAPKDFKKRLRIPESSNGVNMINKTSTATGLYGQLFSEIKDMPELKGITREEFAADTTLQNQLLDMRWRGDIPDVRGLKENVKHYREKYSEQTKDFTNDELAALSHFLGRQGGRNYFASIRDNKSFKVPGVNKTPEEYIKEYRKGKKRGGYKPKFL